MSRKKKQENEPGSGKRTGVHRRTLFKWAIGASLSAIAAADTNAPEAIADAVLDRVINAREPIPADLQKPTTVGTGRKRIGVGIGDSNMAGQGDMNIPLVDRIAEDANARGISMEAISEAENGSLTSALPRQARRAKQRIPKGSRPSDVGVEAWTGENDIRTDTELVGALKRLSRDPLDLGSWRRFFDRRQRAREKLQHSLEKNIEEAARELGTTSVTMYGLSPIQYAKRIVEVDPKTGDATSIPVRSAPSRLEGKINQAVAADLVRQGTRAVVDAAETLKEKGYDVTVIDSAAEVAPSDFDKTDDQHFGPRAAGRIARRRAALFRQK